jgi:uncharacterized protein
MEVLQKDDGKKGKFYVEFDQKEVAEMTYVWAGTDRIIIDHTEVDDTMAGKGLGKQMVHKAVDFAREKGIHVIPLCPFAKKVFDKEKDLRDVL